MDAVAAGRGADQQHQVARLARGGARQVVTVDDADAHGIDERVAAVAGMKVGFAAHGGDADAVAVARDAADNAAEEVTVARLIQRPEAQRIQQRDGPRAHGKDVADDATHARGCALVRLHSAGMVMALDLEHESLPVANVHRAGVLAWSLQDTWP